MQQQLKAGEFCPPDYPKVICKAGPRVVWVGLHKSGFTELCSVTKRTTETPLAAATRKLNQLKDKAGLSEAGLSDASGRPGACVEEQQPAATEEQQPPATEVLVWRPKRKRQVPDFLQPCDALREFATGSRKRKREQSDERCTKRACECAAVSAERDDYKQLCEEQAVAHMRLREEVSAIAHAAAGGDSSAATAASAMQQALLELLDISDPEHDDSEAGSKAGEDEGEQSSDESEDEESEDEEAERKRPCT